MLKNTQKTKNKKTKLIQVHEKYHTVYKNTKPVDTLTPKVIFNGTSTKDFFWINNVLNLCFDIGIFDI